MAAKYAENHKNKTIIIKEMTEDDFPFLKLLLETTCKGYTLVQARKTCAKGDTTSKDEIIKYLTYKLGTEEAEKKYKAFVDEAIDEQGIRGKLDNNGKQKSPSFIRVKNIFIKFKIRQALIEKFEEEAEAEAKYKELVEIARKNRKDGKEPTAADIKKAFDDTYGEKK